MVRITQAMQMIYSGAYWTAEESWFLRLDCFVYCISLHLRKMENTCGYMWIMKSPSCPYLMCLLTAQFCRHLLRSSSRIKLYLLCARFGGNNQNWTFLLEVLSVIPEEVRIAWQTSCKFRPLKTVWLKIATRNLLIETRLSTLFLSFWEKKILYTLTFYCAVHYIGLAISIIQRSVTYICPSVSPSVCLSVCTGFFLTLMRKHFLSLFRLYPHCIH